MNPFHKKSPADLLAMVPDLADPELDALCAAVCDGEWVERAYDGYVYFTPPGKGWGFGGWIQIGSLGDLRANVEAAVVSELTRMIEGEKSCTANEN